MKQGALITVLMLFTIVIGGILIYGRKKEEKEEFKVSVVATGNNSAASDTPGARDKPDTENTDRKLFAYICGEVQKPGVYEVKEGSRIVEILEMAGGFTDEACENYLNLAEPVYDGEKIYVPSEEEIQSGSFAENESSINDGTNRKVNINTADEKTLQTLPGIGENKAEAIVSYRKKNGSFDKTEDIMNVSGIGESIFDRIKDLITV